MVVEDFPFSKALGVVMMMVKSTFPLCALKAESRNMHENGPDSMSSFTGTRAVRNKGWWLQST